MASYLTRARGQRPGPVTYLTRAVGYNLPDGNSYLTRAVGKQRGAVSVDAGLPQTLEPFQVGQLNAVSLTPDVVVDSWTWELLSTSNPKAAATLLSNFNAARYVTPATLTGTTLTFRVTAKIAGQPDSVDTVTHTIRPHGGFWQARGGRYVPINFTFPQPPVTPPSSDTTDTYTDVYDNTY